MTENGNKPAPVLGESSSFQVAVPAVTLPKGGGAIRGIGEKFAANPVTGTGSMSVPIAASPGRSGFGPELSLSYDSGAGNGPFGFGWSLSVPSITRKTDKGLPQYHDTTESDVFILSGAEDLVPVLNDDGTRWSRARNIDGADYRIHRYRPRIEGLFARIERWTTIADPEDIHWRSITGNNILTLYGKDSDSRIVNPKHPDQIFSWLICETRDDKGNAVVYGYRPENGEGVDLTQAHERNRGTRDNPRRTANRYLKHIRYGNRQPLLDNEGQRPPILSNTAISDTDWMFEVVFDYGEGHYAEDAPDTEGRIFVQAQNEPPAESHWPVRPDPFSTYRAGFEVRTYRLCRRVLMFHHFPDEPGVGDNCLVRSTDFTYSHAQDPTNVRNPVYTFLQQVIQSGYKRQDNSYLKRSLPPLAFEYTQPVVQDIVEEVDAESLANLPIGLDGAAYQWTDLHGEGIPGILTEQGNGWFYKRNLSPLTERPDNGTPHPAAKFAPVEQVASKPNLNLAGGAQFMDLDGDGQPDLVTLDDPVPGLYEHDGAESWQPFRPFIARLNRDMHDPNLKFVDLDGDGHADILITEDNAFVWHASLGEAGFGPARRVHQALDEEKGPRLVFADGTQSIYLADLSGDGLTDLVRLRNGEVCYWPNLGYARFGARVSMDHAPHFDYPDQFDHKRIRLADIDGTGTTDIIYLHRDGVRLYFNQSGNSWSEPQELDAFPRVDDLAGIMPVDLLGNGTACLVWSSSLPGDTTRPMRYVNLMGGQKPHLLVKTFNNLGAETRVHYTPSTRFYLQDKRDGQPWITRLPFPVHVVERVETYDHISRNRFVTRYAYHHGYFDGEEREFRGFGMVEQWDTGELAVLTESGAFPTGDNMDIVSHVPPVHTKTWFHTGVYRDRQHVSRQFEEEYYREPDLTPTEIGELLLPDTHLPDGLTIQGEREACRALKGMMLRQEVYADDALPESPADIIRRAKTPYTVVEQDFTIRPLQAQGDNRHAVFFVHPREAITYHYERNPADPRIQHALTLAVDDFGNVLKEAAIGYGRRRRDTTLPTQADKDKQTQTLFTYTENHVTHPIEEDDAYRTPLPAETRAYELTGYIPTGSAGRFQASDFVETDPGDVTRLHHVFDAEVEYEEQPTVGRQRRLVEQVRTYYRRDDLTGLLPLGENESLALPGESYQLAFTPGLLTQILQRDGLPLLTDPAAVLGGKGADQGGYVELDGNSRWWIPSGRVFYDIDADSTNPAATAAQELSQARQNFFMQRKFADAFGQIMMVTFDAYDLLLLETQDTLGNRVTVGERLLDGSLDETKPGNDYRVLLPWRVMDPNRNRSQAAFDVLGMVVGTAVMGKPEETNGDSLADFKADLSDDEIWAHLTNPLADPHAILNKATTRLIYDLFAHARMKDEPQSQPAVLHTLARETHAAGLEQGRQTKIQHTFSYSDGFGREIQQKIQAEPETINGAVGPPRWVGSGWTIFNNKGNPVRQYEPFFSVTHGFEFGVQTGVSPILFYDPLERVTAVLHPNHTYEKVVFDPWRQTTWDVNDTVLNDPAADSDVSGFIHRLPDTEYRPSWHALRTDPAHALDANWHWPNERIRSAERNAALRATLHANTPNIACFDTLGRPFLTLADNGSAPEQPDQHLLYATRVEQDIEGNQRAVIDAKDLIVMRYDYDMIGNRLHQTSMEAGERWILHDVSGNPIRAWDSRGHSFRTEYDPLRRPLRLFVAGANPAQPTRELLTDRQVYGEQHPQAEERNLRGHLYLHLDQAGAVAGEAHDFKGNPLRVTRRIAKEYKQAIDWGTANSALPGSPTEPLVPTQVEAALNPLLEDDTYARVITYDALNRPITLRTPDNSIIRPSYNEANLLERVDVMLRGETANGQPVWTPFVANIDYEAKGLRTRIDYGNGAGTFYEYDPLTFRLVQMRTRRNMDAFPDDCPQPPSSGWPGCQVQNLHYTYDPVGNITHIHDEAQQTIYFRNRRVEPSAEYTYDAIYRLVEATGREHLGQTGGISNAPLPHSHNDVTRVGIDWSANDGNAMGTYIERYVYDAVGNFLKMQHRGSDPSHPGWTRTYEYDEPSLIELGKVNNRLSRSTISNGNPIVEQYAYDAHGNMTLMPHLSLMHWDYRDQLQNTAQQVVTNGGTPETTYYIYDAAGQRVRKVTEHYAPAGQPPRRKAERIYFGGFEIYRRYEADGETPALERETLHIMDEKQRIAMVETRTQGSDPAPEQLVRYQFSNHLGSASLELDDQAQIISYEEYTPYGSTSYQAVRSRTETSKRYKSSGKERDEESGLYYHGARYYAPWMGRWASGDPVGITDTVNLYVFVASNPVQYIDPTGKESLAVQAAVRVGAEGLKAGAKAVIAAQTADLLTPEVTDVVPQKWVGHAIIFVSAVVVIAGTTAYLAQFPGSGDPYISLDTRPDDEQASAGSSSTQIDTKETERQSKRKKEAPIEYVHYLDPDVPTDIGELIEQIGYQVEGFNTFIESGGVEEWQMRIEYYELNKVEMESRKEAHLRVMRKQGPLASGQAHLHKPDVAVGGDPESTPYPSDARVNSIIGGNATSVQNQALSLERDVEKVYGVLHIVDREGNVASIRIQ